MDKELIYGWVFFFFFLLNVSRISVLNNLKVILGQSPLWDLIVCVVAPWWKFSQWKKLSLNRISLMRFFFFFFSVLSRFRDHQMKLEQNLDHKSKYILEMEKRLQDFEK